MLVGTEAGIFQGSVGLATTWAPIQSVPDIWTTALLTASGLHNDPQGIVRAVTWGRGVWQRVFPSLFMSPPPRRVEAVFQGPETMKVAPSAAILRVSFNGQEPISSDVKIRLSILSQNSVVPGFS